MDSINAWAISLCAAALVCTILGMTTPKNSTGNLFKIITAAFFLVCMLTPLSRLPDLMNAVPPATPPAHAANNELNGTIAEQLCTQTEAAIMKILREPMAERGILIKKVTITMDTDETGSIYINGITIFPDKQNNPPLLSVREIAEQTLGIGIKIEIKF